MGKPSLKIKQKLRILQVLPYFDPSFGGPVSTTKSLAEMLVARGHQVTVLASNVSNDATKPYLFNQHTPYTVVLVPTLFPALAARLKLFFSIDSILWFLKHGREFQIVHFQDIFIPTYCLIGLICMWRNIPFVITPHGSLTFSPSRGKVFVKKLLYASGIGWLVANARAVIAVARPEQQYLKKLLPTQKVLWLPTLVPTLPTTPTWSLRKLGLPSRSPYFVFLGRLYELKGVVELLQGFAQYCKNTRKKAPIAHLVFAGPDAGSLNTLKKLSRRLGVTQSVHFVGLVTGSKKTWLLKRALALTLLSKSEGFPTVIAEAASLSIPTICTKECNVPGLVRAEGAIQTTRNPDRIAQVLDTVAHSASRKQKMGRAAKQWYTTVADPKSLEPRYEKMYYQLG